MGRRRRKSRTGSTRVREAPSASTARGAGTVTEGGGAFPVGAASSFGGLRSGEKEEGEEQDGGESEG
jgi:hypothetical protein